MKAAISAALLALVASCLPAAAQEEAAQDTAEAPIGREEFLTSCAPCHGREAKGDGPVARYVGDTFPDLTRLAARNDGAFPVVQVFRTIEGTAHLQAHGERLMPVWGRRYMVEGTFEDLPLSDATRQQIVLGRIVELVNYLQTIQDPPPEGPSLLE